LNSITQPKKKTRSKRVVYTAFFLLGVLLMETIWIVMIISGYGFGMIGCETYSMYPSLYCGCISVNQRVSSTADVDVGDVITFRYNRGTDIRTAVHRIIEKKEYLVTKGDNNGHADGFINYNQVTSKVLYSVCLPQEWFLEDAEEYNG
jgi:signal peptidase I